MKKSIFTLEMFCYALMGKAQVTDEQSAILQLGDKAQIFYGADALKEAVEAAPDRGATITLSAGTFNGTTITKCVNIYGAGWVEKRVTINNENPADNSIMPTIILYGLTISLPEELTAPHNIHIEGLRIPYSNPANGIFVDKPIDGLDIMKCAFENTSNSRIYFSADNKNVVITQCVAYDIVGLGNNALIQNCWLCTTASPKSLNTESIFVINHCLFYVSDTNDNCRYICNNSIIRTAGYGTPRYATYNNCVFDRGNIGNIGSTGNFFEVNIGALFTDGANTNYTDDRTFELTDEAKATYIGNDGTEIGINGGNYTWNKLPHTPLVKDLQLSIDGKQLKVEYSAETR